MQHSNDEPRLRMDAAKYLLGLMNKTDEEVHSDYTNSLAVYLSMLQMLEVAVFQNYEARIHYLNKLLNKKGFKFSAKKSIQNRGLGDLVSAIQNISMDNDPLLSRISNINSKRRKFVHEDLWRQFLKFIQLEGSLVGKIEKDKHRGKFNGQIVEISDVIKLLRKNTKDFEKKVKNMK